VGASIVTWVSLLAVAGEFSTDGDGGTWLWTLVGVAGGFVTDGAGFTWLWSAITAVARMETKVSIMD
jgi:hypothetical protein